jgi:FkbM family methyltransferase
MAGTNVRLLHHIRSRWHPLHHLRRLSAARWLMSRVDVPIWARLYGVAWPVRLRLVRNASYLLNRRTHEPEIGALFAAILGTFRPRSFWDIGANIGQYSWLTKSIDPQVSVFLFEPDPVNIELIRQTITRAQLRHCELFPHAVSSCEGAATFTADAVSGATGTLEAPEDAFVAVHYGVRPQRISVPTVTVDGVRRKTGPVDLVKIDVEGHEASVFAGAGETLTRDQPILIFESFRPPADVLTRLRDLGYRLFDAERFGPRQLETTNFLALPAERVARWDELKTRWRAEAVAWGVAR